MAGSIDPTDYEAQPVYGGIGKMRAALDKRLAEMDPKAERRRKRKSSHGRSIASVIEQTSARLFLEEMLRREKQTVIRQQTAARVARHRAKCGRRDRPQTGG